MLDQLNDSYRQEGIIMYELLIVQSKYIYLNIMNVHVYLYISKNQAMLTWMELL